MPARCLRTVTCLCWYLLQFVCLHLLGSLGPLKTAALVLAFQPRIGRQSLLLPSFAACHWLCMGKPRIGALVSVPMPGSSSTTNPLCRCLLRQLRLWTTPRLPLMVRRNLVDPASSHMLVSKIKPCMSQYKLLYGETANGSLKQL